MLRHTDRSLANERAQISEEIIAASPDPYKNLVGVQARVITRLEQRRLHEAIPGGGQKSR